MAEIKNSSGTIRLGSTNRLDNWWIEPLITGFGFICFVIYTTWAMFQGDYYWWSNGHQGFGGYLSPAQIKYCANDVIYLHKINDALDKILIRENRMKLYEDTIKFVQTRVDLDLASFKEDIWSH